MENVVSFSFVQADCLSSFVLQNSMAGPALVGLQLSNSRGQHLVSDFHTL